MQVEYTKQLRITMSEEDAKILLLLLEGDIEKYTDVNGSSLNLPKDSNTSFALPLYAELERALNG